MNTLHIKNGLRRFDRARKKQMQSMMGTLLSAISNRRSTTSNLVAVNETKRIVIVRNNSRVGNTVFLIPFIRQVKETYPDAEITLVQKARWQQQMFDEMGVDHFVASQFTFKNVWRFVQTIRNLRQTTYDLCFMPFGSSQDAIICALLDAKNKVAFASEHYDPAFTHTLPMQRVYSHAALKCLTLLPQLLHRPIHKTDHQMSFSEQELATGQAARSAIGDKQQLCIAFFRGARGDKKMGEQAWQAVLEKFDAASDQAITWVEVMGPEIDAPLGKGRHVYRAASLRELACFLKHMDGFISCDTGPLHLADAANAPCIGLYTHTNPDVYGLLGERCAHINNLDEFDAKKALATVLACPSSLEHQYHQPNYGSESQSHPHGVLSTL